MACELLGISGQTTTSWAFRSKSAHSQFVGDEKNVSVA